MDDSQAGYFARNRRRRKRRSELHAAGVGDQTGDSTARDNATFTDPHTNPVNAANPAWDVMKPPPG
jgi:hypothetical protein